MCGMETTNPFPLNQSKSIQINPPMKTADDLLYYHCAIYSTGTDARLSSWVGWAQSSDDAEGQARDDYEEGHPGVTVRACCEGHE